MDIDLEATRTAPAGTALTLSFKSWYEIEWDFDYGFVMISTDKGKTFQTVASEEGRTTPREFNPFTSACQEKYGNGITGSSGSPAFPLNAVERTNGPMAAPEFIDDSYDISRRLFGGGVRVKKGWGSGVLWGHCPNVLRPTSRIVTPAPG